MYHDKEDIDQLDRMNKDEQYMYYSAPDFKRHFPNMSLRFIRKGIQALGKRWKKLAVIKKEKDSRVFTTKQVLWIVGNILRGFDNDKRQILFMDEFSMPL